MNHWNDNHPLIPNGSFCEITTYIKLYYNWSHVNLEKQNKIFGWVPSNENLTKFDTLFILAYSKFENCFKVLYNEKILYWPIQVYGSYEVKKILNVQ